MSSRIVALAHVISENAAVVDDQLRSAGLPLPSFDVGAPKKPRTTGDAELARNKVIAAANELGDLMTGPAGLLRFDWTERMTVRMVLRLGLARAVPVGEELSFAALAARAGLAERDVRRICRHAMTRHIFVEPRAGFVAHTALSQLLARDAEQQDVTSTVVDAFLPASLAAADAVARWPGSEEPDETGFALAHNPGKTMWQTFADEPEMGRRFGVFIGEGGASEELLQLVDWRGKVVDVGGSHGDVMVDILRKRPDVTLAVVQDLPETIATGRERAPADLHGRLRFEAHDFFTPQTEAADMFFLRWIFHNWSNKYSLKILRALVPAMKRGTKLIINDYLLPEPNTLPPGLEKAIRGIDMTMLMLLNAAERDAQGWHDMLAEADDRFKITSIRPAAPGIMAIIQVEWEG